MIDSISFEGPESTRKIDKELVSDTTRETFRCEADLVSDVDVDAVSLHLTDYELYKQQHPTSILLGVNGDWYDVTHYITYHPGGTFIKQFDGQDVSCQVRAFHFRDVVKGFTPIGSYDQSDTVIEYSKMHDELKQKGFFNVSKWFLVTKPIVAFSFLAGSQFCIKQIHRLAPTTDMLSKKVVGLACGAGLLLGLFWHQNAYLMHDAMHNGLTHKRKTDKLMGSFFGSVCLGLNHGWWMREHFVHHALPNMYSKKTHFYDPQMRENVCAQNRVLFGSYMRNNFFFNSMQYLAIKSQKYSYIPYNFCWGRGQALFNSYTDIRKVGEFVGLGLHNFWVYLFLQQIPDWRLVAITYGTAWLAEGIVHLQLLLNHYIRPWTEIETINEDNEWPIALTNSAVNVRTSRITDWFWCGLNFHIEHHLFPSMPRENLRKSTKYSQAFCAKVNAPYQSENIFSLLYKTTCKMGEMAELFTLDDLVKKEDTSH